MKRLFFILILMIALAGCSSGKGTIAELRQVEITLDEGDDSGNLDKAIDSYERFLKQTETTPLTPEAIRRLADLKVEKEYGQITDEPEPAAAKTRLAPPEKDTVSSRRLPEKAETSSKQETPSSGRGESEGNFERRTTAAIQLESNAAAGDLPVDGDLKRAGAEEAIALYRKLLDDYPQYERNDQTLYQLSRAHEEQGQIEEAMQVMDRLIDEYPKSRYLDEVQFRRGEYFFARRKFLDAGEAYERVVSFGKKSEYHLLALYKLGWSYYKQDLYQDALHQYFALLDLKVTRSFDFENIADDQEKKRVNDTLRSISQSFSSLGGVNAIIDYFSRFGSKSYADVIYANLAEYYFSKQRYSDAVTTYTTFNERNRSHRQAPLFALRVIEINQASGFPSLVVKAKRAYAKKYSFGTDYWKHFNPDKRPDVIAGLKANLIDLGNHFHALYQNPKLGKAKAKNLNNAYYWYREFLKSFPQVDESPAINYQLAELLLENGSFASAAREYEKTAYGYPLFAKASNAGYAAVYAYREHLKQVTGNEKKKIRQNVIRVSLRFAKDFPKHEKAEIVLSAAVDDLYAQKDYNAALTAARDLFERFPKAGADIRRSALLVIAHSSFELESYREAEKAYTEVLQLLPKNDVSRKALTDNLVAAIYKQGEEANRLESYKQAAEHFLRVATVAPKSKLRPTADFDGAVALIKVEEWQGAITVLTGFRESFPKHKLQPEVTKKLAYIYRQEEKNALAAAEFARIETESTDPALRQEALLTAAELYEEMNKPDQAAKAYRRYVEQFPEPLEVNIISRDKLANILKDQGKLDPYRAELQQIVTLEAAATADQTAQTRSIAGMAALILAERDYDKCLAVRLVKPFEKNLQRKQALMKTATDNYIKLFDYEMGVVTAAATYHLAEIYTDFSAALLDSQRPEGLSALELEEFELALEEQAYPFEEKAIEMHQDNLKLMAQGVYNEWIDKSRGKLAIVMPAHYAKQEANNSDIAPEIEYQFENQDAQPGDKKLRTKKKKVKSAAGVYHVTIARLEKGRTGFRIGENYPYAVSQRELFTLGVDGLKSGEYDVAVDCFKSIIEAAPSPSAPYVNLAIAYIRSDQDEQAEEPLKKALEKVAGHPLASHEYGLLLRRAGRFDEARKVYQKSLEQFPEYYPLHKNLGVLCDLYLNDLKCASAQYKEFIKAQPEDEQVKLWLVEVQGRQGQAGN